MKFKLYLCKYFFYLPVTVSLKKSVSKYSAASEAYSAPLSDISN